MNTLLKKTRTFLDKRVKNYFKTLSSAIIKKVRKIKNGIKKYNRNTFWYSICYKKPIQDNLVFVESRDGQDFTGNIFRIVEELAKREYCHLTVVVFAVGSVKNRIEKLQEKYTLGNLRIVTDLDEAIPFMETARYIVSDSGVPWEYAKREGQIVINTWHGTPFKVMGRRTNEGRHVIGTVQHFFFSTDYFVYPNDFMMEVMQEDYMVENLCKGKALLAGYPRNAVFFDQNRAETVRKELNLAGKRVYAYLPTHRSNINKNKKQLESILDYLSEIDAWLEDDQILLAKLHVLNKNKIDFAQFAHVRPFPEEYETYDVLNAVDVLITDYSSVFFDFANTRKKIVLFTYDEQEYFSDRGTYFPIDELPFPRVHTVPDLLKELDRPKLYDDSSFIEKFCKYDCADASRKLCRHVFLNDKCLPEKALGNGKENVIIMGGSLAKNGITTALYNLLMNVDQEKRNYYVAFWRTELNSDPSRIDNLPDNTKYIPLMCDPFFTFREKKALENFLNAKNTNVQFPAILEEAFDRELSRYYYGAEFSCAIQFDGYGNLATMLFSRIRAEKTIVVHNNMVKEISEKDIQRVQTLHWAYNLFNHVALVSPLLAEPTKQISGSSSNFLVLHNFVVPELTISRSNEEIEFQADTCLTSSNPGGIVGVLKRPGKKFITVGRFSPEKQHKQLIDAFDQFCVDYPETQLIIIGGHGSLYNRTLTWRQQARFRDNITIIKSIRNPMPIVKQCDLFLLPSKYEGEPMTIKEADILGLPIVATDIPGNRAFMEEHNGYLCEQSVEGVVEGMRRFMTGEIHPMNVDYCAYNKKVMEEFESLFTNGRQKNGRTSQRYCSGI